MITGERHGSRQRLSVLALLISLEAMENVPPPGIIHIDWKSVSHIDGLNNFGALDNIHAKGLKVAQGGGGARRPRRQAPRRSFDPDAPVLCTRYTYTP